MMSMIMMKMKIAAMTTPIRAKLDGVSRSFLVGIVDA